MRISDWSSDVCSSVLPRARRTALRRRDHARRISQARREGSGVAAALPAGVRRRADGRGHDLDPARPQGKIRAAPRRSEEHTSELQSLMRISYAVFCLKKKRTTQKKTDEKTHTRRN